MNKKILGQLKRTGQRTLIWLALALLFSQLSEAQVLVNCLVAVADDVPISLYDLKVVILFGLEPEPFQRELPLKKEDVVNIYIDELLVLNLARGQINISQEEIDQEIGQTRARLGSQLFEEECQSLGIEADHLIPYIENKLLFEKIVKARLSQRVPVSLQELEDYYNHTYVPETKAKGQPVPEMVNVLTEIEDKLQAIKARGQLSQWLQGLRQKARIIINQDCLEKVELKEEK
jgi:hypothetical protein